MVGFTWQLLRSISKLLAQGLSWRTLFNHAVSNILEYLPDASSARVAGLYGRYKLCQEATMDEVQLRKVDLLAEIRCTCAVPSQHLLADGVWVGCQLRHLCLDAPHLPRLSAVGGVCGSTFQSRIVLPCSKGRDALWAFLAATESAPMCAGDFALMCDSIAPAPPRAQHCAELRTLVQCVAMQVRRLRLSRHLLSLCSSVMLWGCDGHNMH